MSDVRNELIEKMELNGVTFDKEMLVRRLELIETYLRVVDVNTKHIDIINMIISYLKTCKELNNDLKRRSGVRAILLEEIVCTLALGLYERKKINIVNKFDVTPWCK